MFWYAIFRALVEIMLSLTTIASRWLAGDMLEWAAEFAEEGV